MTEQTDLRAASAPPLFHGAGGRDRARDQPPEFDIARYYHEQRHAIVEDSAFLQQLMTAIGAAYDLTPAQWAQWYSVALGFRPDLIVELGRSKGNSTALFCQAASRLGATRVVSLCNSKDWSAETLPKLTPLVPAGWLDRLDARVTDILDVDYAQLFGDAKRVLVLWDAHGFEIAETVLGRILPLLANRSHLILMHDISDNRYAAVPRSYEDQPIWKGSTWNRGTGRSTARVNLGWLTSLQDQVVAIADFAARNEIEIGSADHEYAGFFSARPRAADEMTRDLGDGLFSTSAHWAFFSLAGKAGPFHFPSVQRRFRERADVRLRDVHPPPRWFARPPVLPRVVQTSAVPWEYAAVMAWQPRTPVPPDARSSLRVRVRVDGGPIGVGLLNEDRSTFIQSERLVAETAGQTVFLALPSEGAAGPVVIHAWDESQPGRVVIEEIAIVW